MASWYITKFPGRVNYFAPKMDMRISTQQRNELVKYCEPFVKYEDDADFNGIKIRLYTNIDHVYDFWHDNWWPSTPFTLPHGIIYTIDDGGKLQIKDFYEGPLENPEANVGGLYNPETKTAIIFNNDYYGQTKPTGLGIAADILEDQFGILSVHGASGVIDGRGFLLIGPTNAGKTTHSYGPAFFHPLGEFHQDDWIYVRFQGNKAMGYASEKQFYMRTNSIKNFPWLEPIFRENKLENVRSDEPREMFLPPNPRVMVDPKRIMKPEKVVDRITIYKTFLLKRDREDKFVARSLDPEEAVELLQNAPEKWYNNYLITYGKRKDERRADLFRKLFEMAEPYVINVITDVDKVRGIIIKILES